MHALLLALTLGGAPLADHAADADESTVVAAERELWEAWRTHELEPIERLSTPDYVCIDEDGPDPSFSIAQIRAEFDAYRLQSYKLGRIGVRRVAPDTMILVYNAHLAGVAHGKPLDRAVAEASVWVKRDGAWRNAMLHEVTRTNRDETVDS